MLQEAFSTWVDILENGGAESLSYHDNSYVGACYREARQISKEFFVRLAERTPQAGPTPQARIKVLWQGGSEVEAVYQDLPLRSRRRDEGGRSRKANLLRKAIGPEEEAIDQMRKAQKML